MEEQGGHELLGTIRMPKNMNLLSERLPAAQYDTGKKEDEQPFYSRDKSTNKLQSIAEEDDNRNVIPPRSKQQNYPLKNEKKPPMMPGR